MLRLEEFLLLPMSTVSAHCYCDQHFVTSGDLYPIHNIVTCIPTARQRVGKHIPATKTFNNMTSIAT
jgi:hypothetical protein